MTAPLVGLPHNFHLRAVVKLLPDYGRALDLAEQADAWLRDLKPVPPIPAELNPRQCGRISEEWIAAVAEHEAATTQLQQRQRILVGEKQAATSDAASVFSGGLDKLLGALHEVFLTRLLHDVADIARELNGATTAEQAIAIDAGSAWKRLTELADDYESLRAAQEFIMLRGPHDLWRSARPILGGEAHANLGYLKNLPELWQSWRNPDLAQRVNIDGSKDRLEPWPSDRVQLLLWLAMSRAEPWIPDTRQLRTLLHELANPSNDDEPQHHLERHVLNAPPREDYFSRVAPTITAVPQEVSP